MIISGWQACKVFDGAGNGGDTNTSQNKKSSGGGCVYNPNAPTRFDMGFILLMVLSAYYLIRRNFIKMNICGFFHVMETRI
jgi:hypothetical protein